MESCEKRPFQFVSLHFPTLLVTPGCDPSFAVFWSRLGFVLGDGAGVVRNKNDHNHLFASQDMGLPFLYTRGCSLQSFASLHHISRLTRPSISLLEGLGGDALREKVGSKQRGAHCTTLRNHRGASALIDGRKNAICPYNSTTRSIPRLLPANVLR